MYLPGHFNEPRPEAQHELIRAYPFGALVTHSPTGLDANHIPFHFVPDASANGSLYGHVARQNPLWQAVGSGVEALVIFQGPSGYVSPSWYPAKQEHGKVVPTWNYVVVHAHGTLKVHDDPLWVRHQIELLTRQMESSRAAPWAVADAPAEYLERMMQAIVGIELVIDRLEGKWKVSQNQPALNREGAAAGLEASGQPSAMEMARIIRAYATDTR